MTARWQSMDPSDRAWSHHTSTWVFRGVRLPQPTRVRAALTELAEDPCIGVRLDPEHGRSCFVGRAERDVWVDDVLRSGSAIVPGEPLGDLPFRLVLGTNWFHLEKSHGWADGWSTFTFLAELLRSGTGRPSPRTWTRMGSAHRDLATAWAVGRRPVAAVKAVANRHEHRGGDVEPRSLRAGALTLTTIHQVSTREFAGRLATLRDQFHPGASTLAVFVVGLRSALGAFVVEPRPGVEMAFDTRPQLAGAAREFGNWSSAVYLHPADDRSPSALSEAIRDARRRQLPLLSLAASRVRARRGAELGQDVAAPTGAPRLTVTAQTSRGPLGGIPHDPEAIEVCAVARPNGAEATSVHLVELGGRLHVSLNVHPETWDPAAVRSALTLFLSDPESCLGRSFSEVMT